MPRSIIFVFYQKISVCPSIELRYLILLDETQAHTDTALEKQQMQSTCLGV